MWCETKTDVVKYVSIVQVKDEGHWEAYVIHYFSLASFTGWFNCEWETTRGKSAGRENIALSYLSSSRCSAMSVGAV